MNEPISEKDLLLMMLTKMNEQLLELDSELEASFSDLRGRWLREEADKLSLCARRVSLLEHRLQLVNYPDKSDLTSYAHANNKPPSLKLEIGFH